MTPGKYDLALYRGDSYTWQFRLWVDDFHTDPFDLTGATVAAEIREKSAGTFVVDLACVITLPNLVDMTMEPDQYDTCPAKGVWDLQITMADGQVHTVLAGTVTVTADVTDSVPMPARSRR